MSLSTSPKAICQKYQIKPLRRRGQNFLINEGIIKKILQAAELNKNDNVLEIGPGLGILTKELAKEVKEVVAIEIDRQLVRVLENELRDFKNIKVVQEDIRNIKLSDYGLKKYKIVANLPFNITGLVFKQFLTGLIKPEMIVVMLQKEVGERIIAQPPRMSKLSIMIQFYGQPKIISNIKKDNFWPKPKVDSVILKIKPFSFPIYQDEDIFFQIVRAGFLSPRKYLLNNLEKGAIINKEKGKKVFEEIFLDKKIRAQELSVEDWIKLVKKVKEKE